MSSDMHLPLAGWGLFDASVSLSSLTVVPTAAECAYQRHGSDSPVAAQLDGAAFDRGQIALGVEQFQVAGARYGAAIQKHQQRLQVAEQAKARCPSSVPPSSIFEGPLAARLIATTRPHRMTRFLLSVQLTTVRQLSS